MVGSTWTQLTLYQFTRGYFRPSSNYFSVPPITQICVLNANEDEAVPMGYEIVSQTVAGKAQTINLISRFCSISSLNEKVIRRIWIMVRSTPLVCISVTSVISRASQLWESRSLAKKSLEIRTLSIKHPTVARPMSITRPPSTQRHSI